MAVLLLLPVPVPPSLLYAVAALALAAVTHLLHLPSLLLYALHTYIHPDAVPSSTPRAVLRPPGAAAGSGNPKQQRGGGGGGGKAAASPFDEGSNSAQLYRLRLSHATLATRPRFADFHLALLLPLALLPPALLLPASAAGAAAPLAAAPARRVPLRRAAAPRDAPVPGAPPTSPPRSARCSSLRCSRPARSPARSRRSPRSPPRGSRARSGLGTDQPRSGLAVLASSAPARLLLYLAVLVSSAASILQCCGFLDSPELEVKLLAAAAGLQLLASRAAVQMYLNEAVFCWYQRLHVSRSPDTEYGRAKVFLHNHHLCAVATQLVAPPLLVLSLLALWRVQGKDYFEGVEELNWLVGWSVAMKEAALLAARWIVAVWSTVTVGTLVFYKRGWLFVL
ncbi:hypothetical protein OsJ_19978 [Oryza sativa Japonica Group]|uniref:Uncharacterized protein n=1 Tax=Oryza sativa subsp. japonica TaxID=39947 RepID=A3B801_ORYSJ|nr:hypothetical protein OsJ_19978 [Oryza sativa Japonica Group]